MTNQEAQSILFALDMARHYCQSTGLGYLDNAKDIAKKYVEKYQVYGVTTVLNDSDNTIRLELCDSKEDAIAAVKNHSEGQSVHNGVGRETWYYYYEKVSN